MLIQLLFIGTSELLLIGGLALLLFGGKKLPEMMRGLGQGVQSFKKGMKEPLAEITEKDSEEANGENEETKEGESKQ
ncbi:MAG: twin-arginine translocase TatA/TatE family subunit [Bacteroidaceae bacterium]|nr:twin-arginine translocase TatA/TatE family subunit [Bacteroidaceae bacterium]MBR6590469.1 twin-arginine translocase TatA/TatE family subunit [Bacteroidaceae bacterium]